MRPNYVTLTAVGTSTPLPVTWNQLDFRVGLGISHSGVNTSHVEFTLDDLQDTSITPAWVDHATLLGITGSAFANLTTRCRAVRLIMDAYTNGYARLTLIQARPER
jgi:hypothetical protein